MKYLSIALMLLLLGCNPWQNEEEANLQQFVELDGEYFAYYTQEMWDGTIQFLIKLESKPEASISSPLGKLAVKEEAILINDFKQPNHSSKSSLRITDGLIVFCSSSGCKNITHMSRLGVNK